MPQTGYATLKKPDLLSPPKSQKTQSKQYKQATTKAHKTEMEKHTKNNIVNIFFFLCVLQPFWPTGSGCARGFLGAFDAAWMIRSWAGGRMTPLEVIAERESIFTVLSQTTPGRLHKNHHHYSLDPNTRSVVVYQMVIIFCLLACLFTIPFP